MKPKKYFKQQAESIIQGAVKKTYTPWQRFKRFLNHNPKATVAVMITTAVLNFVALFAFTDNFKSVSFSYKSIKAHLSDSTETISDMGVPFSLQNFWEMKAIQDTLQYLAAKEQRTKAETAVMMRLFERMEKLDPNFFNKLKQLTHEKDSFYKK